MELIINKPDVKAFYGSDFHADFWKDGIRSFLKNVDIDDYDLFLFAGDVGEWKDENCREIYKEILRRGKAIVMVPGNHEFYRSMYQLVCEQLGDFAKDNENFFYLERNFIDLPVQKTRIWGDTFWTDFQGDRDAIKIAARYMNDYRQIFFDRQHGSVLLEPEDTVVLNDKARKSLIEMSKDLPEGWHLFVMTHHAPFCESTPKSYRKPEYTDTAKLNKAYANDLYDWCERTGVYPDAWIHGHIHERANYVIEWENGCECRVQSNPFGYPGQNNVADVAKHAITFSKIGVKMV